MKRRSICVFSLIIILLIAFTIFSRKIETEMTLDVVIINAKSSPIRPLNVPIDCLFYDEKGYHLYGTYEGTGWEAGTRVKEIPKSEYKIVGNYIVMQGVQHVSKNAANGVRNPENGIIEWSIIKTASRQPNVGELINNYERIEMVKDTYLAIYPDGAPEDCNLDSLFGKIIATSKNAILIQYERALSPFMPKNAKGLFEVDDTSNISTKNWELYSVSEIKEFEKAMKYLIIVVGILVLCLILWGFSCYFSKKDKVYRKYIYMNVCVIACLLTVLVFVVEKIDLPSSLLPADSIFNIRFYMEEFTEIFEKFNMLKS